MNDAATSVAVAPTVPFGMLCIILTERAHCGREVTVLDTLSMRLDCEDTTTAISLVWRLQDSAKIDLEYPPPKLLP